MLLGYALKSILLNFPVLLPLKAVSISQVIVSQGESGFFPNYPLVQFDGLIPVAFFQMKVGLPVADGLYRGRRRSAPAMEGAPGGD